MMTLPTLEELARKAREALSRVPPMSACEHFTWMVREGFINAKGEVAWLIGGFAEPEPNDETWTMEDEPRPDGAGS